jgi:hypothetical protein
LSIIVSPTNNYTRVIPAARMTEGHELALRVSGIRTAQLCCADIFQTPEVSAFACAKASGVTLTVCIIIYGAHYIFRACEMI